MAEHKSACFAPLKLLPALPAIGVPTVSAACTWVLTAEEEQSFVISLMEQSGGGAVVQPANGRPRLAVSRERSRPRVHSHVATA